MTMMGIFIIVACFSLAKSSLPRKQDDSYALLDSFGNGYDMNSHLKDVVGTRKRKDPFNIIEKVRNILDYTKDKKSFSSLRYNRRNGKNN